MSLHGPIGQLSSSDAPAISTFYYGMNESTVLLDIPAGGIATLYDGQLTSAGQPPASLIYRVASHLVEFHSDAAVTSLFTPVSLEPFAQSLANIQSTVISITSQSSDLSTLTSSATLTTSPSSSTFTSTTNSAISSPGSTTIPPTQTGSPTHSSLSHAGVTSGAAAGIAVGCLAAGIIIATLAFCLLRRRSASGRKDRETGGIAFMPLHKQPDVNVNSLGNSSPVSGIVDNNLPQPIEDNALSGEVAKISNSIKNHVQSYYHSGRATNLTGDVEGFQALGHGLPVSAGTLSALLANPETREIALRFCIARVAISRSQPDSEPGATFLPPELAACFQSMSTSHSPQVHAAFMSKWRTITAELLQSAYIRNAFSPTDPRNRNIAKALQYLDEILRSYSDSRMDDGQRRRNLEEILKRVASFAFTLFSQPSSWKFDWQDDRAVEPGSLVIFPSLVQLSDETGQPLQHPRPLSEAIARPIDL